MIVRAHDCTWGEGAGGSRQVETNLARDGAEVLHDACVIDGCLSSALSL